MAIELMRCSVQPDRTRFTLDKDCYDDWVILSACTGAFSFSLELDRSSEWARRGRDGTLALSGECVFGGLVLCPPRTILHRRITSRPTSFLFAEFKPDPAPRPGKASVRDVQRLASTYDYIADTCAEPTSRSRHGALVHLVEDLLFVIHTERARFERPVDALMTQVASILKENAFAADLSLGALAGRLGLSPSSLTRRFRAVYGATPMGYVTATRLARARQLLLETDQTLEAVATKCGYRNSYYFSRVFRQKMGLTPSRYRRAYRI